MKNRVFAPVMLLTAQPEVSGSFPSPLSHYLLFFPLSDLLAAAAAAAASLGVSVCLFTDARLARDDTEVRQRCWFVLSERQQERTTETDDERGEGDKGVVVSDRGRTLITD